MFRSVALSALLVLGVAATTNAGPVTFYADGSAQGAKNNPITNWVGFDPSPGNILNVGGAAAIANFVANGNMSGPNTQFLAFAQSNVLLATRDNTGGGPAQVAISGGFTAVIGATETVIGVTGIQGVPGSTAQFDLVPGGSVNYFQIFRTGNAFGGDDLSGTGFNTGTLVLSGTLQTLINTNPVQVGTTTSNLDQFGLVNNYPGNLTVGLSGNIAVSGVIDFANPNFFETSPGETLVGGSFDLTTQLQGPFTAVDPSAAFLINSLLTAVGETPVTSGAGLGLLAGLLETIGVVNGGPLVDGGGDPLPNGLGVQLQTDANVTFQPIQITTTTTIPEPATLAVFGLMAGMGGLVYRKRRSSCNS